jgi:hypothetical protein
MGTAGPRGRGRRAWHRYDAATVLRRIFPRRVAVGLAVATLFVVSVVAAGYVFRDRGSSKPRPTPTTTLSTTSQGANQ